MHSTHTYSGDFLFFLSPADFVRLPWQRNDQSIILMVGLFEQGETE